MKHSFFYSFILSLFTSALVLGMASCGDGVNDGNEPANKQFQINVHNVTRNGATIQITPSDKEAPYYWELVSGKKINTSGISTVEEFVKITLDREIYDNYLNTGDLEVVIPSEESGYGDLDPYKEYVVIVFKVDKNNKPIFETLVYERFTTLYPEGAVKGVFTIGKGKRVFFSKGNLQYQAASIYNMSFWRFAEEQWDFVGDDAKGTVHEAGVKSNNELISENYTGWIDLFGWGTGNQPTKTSANIEDYSVYSEWGNNPIKNGGNKAGQWRTMTDVEWEYLFHERNRADELFGLGTVNGINGTIILPDNWQPLDDVPFTPSTQCTDGYLGRLRWNALLNAYVNSLERSYEHNTLNTSQWHDMEEHGAVFLPAAGYRLHTGTYDPILMEDIGTYGTYWSKTPYNNNNAYCLFFSASSLHPQYIYSNNNIWVHGRSVRLVRDVE